MQPRRRFRFYGLAGFAVLALIPVYLWRENVIKGRVQDSANYRLTFDKPAGWDEEPPGLQTLFIYRQPQWNIALRGSQSQVVADHNPTPELDRDGLTNQFAQLTTDNLGWKVAIQDTVECQGSSYRIIRRETVDRTVVTAIAVKGNTTILITMIGIGKGKGNIDKAMPTFRDFLAKTTLDQHMSYE